MSFSNLQKITIHYDETAVQSMVSMIKFAPFPSQAPIDAREPWSLGVDYEYLRALKNKFETDWQWERVEGGINKFDSYSVDYTSPKGDQLELHFIHQRSERADAIPLMLLHGWPGTVYDFHKVIEPLANPSSDELPAFHVVAPSLPGFFKSSLPRRDGWSLLDTAGLLNSLMTELLGYKKYAGQGGDWGAMIARIMSNIYPESLVSVHLNAFDIPSLDDVDESTLSEVELRMLARGKSINETGRGYGSLQSTKPFTIGLAIASSPFAILAYIAEKIHDWSDPARICLEDIIDTVALYFLSSSFATSVMSYNQAFKDVSGSNLNSFESFSTLEVKSKTLGFSAFPYEIDIGLKQSVAAFGNLAYYKQHEAGGHFPALDSSEEFVVDLREFFARNFD
ncbi:alpha/beta-hydrolase [Cytidiella melzeri]|nr:alpha/beta-hydrolase [Cytidiella melzeri]